MKRLIMLMLVSSISSVAIATEFSVPHITVYGKATIQVVPDEMTWWLEVSTKANSVEDTAETHDENVSSVLNFLKNKDVDSKKVQTSRIQLSENSVYRNNTWVREGFKANTSIRFESGHIHRYRELWIGLSKLSDVSVKNVTFGTSKRIDIQNESRLKAAKAAREKAIALANSLDSVINEPLQIEEDQ